MKQFDIKKGWFGNIEGDKLPRLMEAVFGNVEAEAGMYVSSFGVMERIEVAIASKTILEVNTVNKTGTFEDSVIIDSKRALNKFMEDATGFDAKARMKREQKKAKEGKI